MRPHLVLKPASDSTDQPDDENDDQDCPKQSATDIHMDLLKIFRVKIFHDEGRAVGSLPHTDRVSWADKS